MDSYSSLLDRYHNNSTMPVPAFQHDVRLVQFILEAGRWFCGEQEIKNKAVKPPCFLSLVGGITGRHFSSRGTRI